MKQAALFAAALGLSFGISACASAPKPEPVASTSSALTAPGGAEATAASPKTDTPSDTTAAVKAKSGDDEKATTGGRGDPLAVDASLEAAAVPTIAFTPKNKLRGKTRGDLDAAMGLVKTATTVDGAAAKLEQRLGKPTWTENGKRRVWVAMDGNKCHRLVLDSDGQVDVETADKNERRMLSALAKQNPCTGEILREGL